MDIKRIIYRHMGLLDIILRIENQKEKVIVLKKNISSYYNSSLVTTFGADIKDIAPMKIAAIADRGTKRDFIDLYFIFAKTKILTLKETLGLYDKKFKALRQNKMHILKSLVYFEDAEKDKLPQMIKQVRWSSVKRFFISEQQKIAEEILGVYKGNI